MENKDEVPKEVQKNLKSIIDSFDIEERAVRERQIRTWRKLKLYWEGFQRIWYDEVAHDWRIWDVDKSTDTQDAAAYDKPVNVFRAYLESIIAALSITVPTVSCAPDDADSPLDIETAKASNAIAELIYKHNDVILLWLHALYIFCTEGMVACYSYSKESYEYGEYKENNYSNIEAEQYVCPNCRLNLADDVFTNELVDEFMPDDEDIDVQYLISKGAKLCPQCGFVLDPSLQKEKVVITKLVGVTTKPKSRICLEAYGGLYVKVPNYAMKQADMPYLNLSYETHYSNALSRYSHLRDKVTGDRKIGPGSGGNYDPYERWGRLSPQYHGEYPTNTCTIRNWWLRPCSYETLNDETQVEELKRRFPNGAKVVLVNDCFAEACNESLDDCWTLTKNPLSDYIHHDPLGLLLISIQDITNDLISLVLQTIEHGIPQTFADPEVLNFNAYGQSETAPGTIYPAKPRSGKSVGEAFYEVKTATLSGEVLPFAQRTQEMGQLVSGALPSLFGGGASAAGSKTAAEYSMSRAQAQQRLQNTWKMLTIWWKEIFGKAIPAFMKEMVEDEKFTKKDKSGNYINVFIRKSQLYGKIGNVELEPNDQLPVTWAQKKDVIMQLMTANNPLIIEALTAPENLDYLKQAIGLDEFELPGEDDRIKQYEEINQLLNSEPIELPPPPEAQMAVMMGQAPPEMLQPQQIPSVEIDPELDDHMLEAELCKRWLKSEAGRLAKIENPKGYMNVLLHMKMHVMEMQKQMMEQMMQQMAMQPQQGANGSAGPKENQSAVAPKNRGKDGTRAEHSTVQ